MSADRGAFASAAHRADAWLRARPAAGEVWPLHWSQVLGHLVLVAFAVLVVTGILLTVPYDPGIDPVTYRGAAELYDGRQLPRAFASIVRISNDIPGGGLVRRVHAAAAHLLVGATVLHLARVLLTGAFQGRRARNHVLGVALLAIASVAGWTGENLSFGLLAGTSLRIGYAVLGSLPYIGEPLAVAAYGGDYPTGRILQRSFWAHTVVLPVAFTAGAALHLWLVRRHTPTTRPHDGDVLTIRGVRAWPGLTVRLLVLLLAVTALLLASAVVIPWSDIALEGPYQPAQAGNTLQPPWYLFLPEGAMRILPAMSIPLPGGAAVGNLFVAAVVLPSLLWTALLAYPWLDRRLGGSRDDRHVLEHPLDVPGRAAAVTFLLVTAAVLTAGATVDVIARALQVPVGTLIIALRIALLVLPVAGAGAAWEAARRRRADGESERRGRESNP